ncbi:MAG: 50S ribosomal protein L24 [Candidatus Daviesbacteria bacterium GW2011_GWA1_41_61]|uniref:Large ribosomal subunit protein uL24 n=1 Tax=Candidatus Daviesbacteria bacterium GW2011_GWA2_40_9 TaxID=1618424 RepID=A0A0G0TYW8_9BACT|nr:MAG: 50S ribosomal protein L24 [Candidatus Daviesbacteria bacterium GW2011_GWC1_40_9]KKR82078.1 MAG: 50S ribosomal protein L24 [Candidatus Daviesbacteria bacterium GW2011_GWA2_40_9]KKR93261.1 MAG: 50S ribosomal protein L24 [Candidatus Daviesbacteria bacterium GW2011_GWB1_41_15]KKS14749.1 MAG: 50S ribosomal protein L24 [Candidatus Daviesbacteria bacterium GW2011_GWA1_41_61]
MISRNYSFKIKKGDEVRILLGKDRGRNGKVIRLLTKAGKILVEGINLSKRHVRKSKEREGGVIELVKPIDISNVALICSHCKQPTRVGFEMNGKVKQRICRKCREAVI